MRILRLLFIYVLRTLFLLSFSAFLQTATTGFAQDASSQVAPAVETEPMPSSGDSADDPAIWIHPDDPSQSIIIGTDKKGGLAVYNLAGQQLDYLLDGDMNNVDLRYNFPLGGQSVALVTAGNRTDNSIAIYQVDVATRKLENVAARTITAGLEVYGSCMYHSPVTGKYYVYLNSKDGEVEQWELFADHNGRVDGVLTRSFEVGSQTEGCVADDELSYFYIGEETKGIWKYKAEPSDGTSRTQVDKTGAGGHLTADVEGLTLYYTSNNTGYLIASSQGSDEYVVYRREENNEWIMTFKIVAGNGIDAVSGTDGIDVTNFNLGPAFPQGVFVAQDGNNDDSNQNYKLVPWQAIANTVNPALVIDTSWDPRQVGAGEPAPIPTPSIIWSYLPLILKKESSTITPTPWPTLEHPDPQVGIWISSDELADLPTSGVAWDHLKAVADQKARKPDLSDQNDETNVQILAKALVYARTGEPGYRDEVVTALRIITFNNTEKGGVTLALGRELAAYVIAADLINLANYDPALDAQFRNKLRQLLTKDLDGLTLQLTHELRPNNWGTHAGASRAAVAVYLGDTVELARTAQVFKGWLGNRETYADFIYGELWWQCDPVNPVGINPKGCLKQGRSIDGALPEEMRRGGQFRWPPRKTNYTWEALQGALVQAEILHRAGYPIWEWQDQALLRAVQFLYDIGWSAEGDDLWQIWLVNHAYGTTFPTASPVNPGKNMGWTDWTHSGYRH